MTRIREEEEVHTDTVSRIINAQIGNLSLAFDMTVHIYMVCNLRML